VGGFLLPDGTRAAPKNRRSKKIAANREPFPSAVAEALPQQISPPASEWGREMYSLSAAFRSSWTQVSTVALSNPHIFVRPSQLKPLIARLGTTVSELEQLGLQRIFPTQSRSSYYRFSEALAFCLCADSRVSVVDLVADVEDLIFFALLRSHGPHLRWKHLGEILGGRQIRDDLIGRKQLVPRVSKHRWTLFSLADLERCTSSKGEAR
jgi:hypothetical protein